MGTREVYEEKLRRGNLHHDPTIRPGLGSARCPRCLSLLNPINENSEWEITPVLHDATTVAGSGIGGLLSAVHGFNTGISYVQNRVKGPNGFLLLLGFLSFLCFQQQVQPLEAMHFLSSLNSLSHLIMLLQVHLTMGFHCSLDTLKTTTCQEFNINNLIR